MKIRMAAMLAGGSLWLVMPVLAQDAAPQQNRMQRQAEQLKTALDLTDRQYNELNDVRTAYNEKIRDLSAQIRELEKQRREAMKTSGADPVQVGSITLQQQSLQQQIQEENKAYRERALSVLTASQREKVEDIQEAIQLARQAGALAAFGLLENEGGMRGFMGGGPAMMMRGEDAPPPGR